MAELKTFFLAVLIVGCTFVLVAMKILQPDGWWQGTGVAATLYGVRTVADKMTKAKRVVAEPQNGGLSP
jgi:hypothetical protein